MKKKKNERDGRRQTVFNQPLAVENVQVAFYIRHTHRLRQLPAVKTVVTGMNFPFAGALAVALGKSDLWPISAPHRLDLADVRKDCESGLVIVR